MWSFLCHLRQQTIGLLVNIVTSALSLLLKWSQEWIVLSLFWNWGHHWTRKLLARNATNLQEMGGTHFEFVAERPPCTILRKDMFYYYLTVLAIMLLELVL